MNIKKLYSIVCALFLVCVLLCGCVSAYEPEANSSLPGTTTTSDEIPPYTTEPYVVLNNNIPSFKSDALTAVSFERYSELDALGRCQVAEACVGVDIMPTEERGAIGQVKPSGWHTVKYDVVDGKYLYNRCHLIGFQLTGENANDKNLITGTRYFNVEGMLPFENMVADYVKETSNHVMFRVTPIYTNENLVADGVIMEAYSVEDKGEGICFNVFVYNVQPGVVIDYATGESRLADNTQTNTEEKDYTYILNTNSKKFHLSTCSNANDISPKNKKESNNTREEIIKNGFTPCKTCNP